MLKWKVRLATQTCESCTARKIEALDMYEISKEENKKYQRRKDETEAWASNCLCKGRWTWKIDQKKATL